MVLRYEPVVSFFQRDVEWVSEQREGRVWSLYFTQFAWPAGAAQFKKTQNDIVARQRRTWAARERAMLWKRKRSQVLSLGAEAMSVQNRTSEVFGRQRARLDREGNVQRR